MARRTSINVSLTPQLERFVARKVAAGRYGTASEVVREGLRLLEERDRERDARLDEIRRKISVGLEQLQRGEARPADEVGGELRRALRRRRRQAR